MAAIKSVARSAITAFAPTSADLLAMGTMAGAIDLAFNTSASLDIFNIDFSIPGQEVPLINSYAASDRFNRLSWGFAGSGSEAYPYGLIAGSLVDGSINIWNPDALRSSDKDSESSLLAKLQKHTGHVRGLEFNVLTPNLLASGGDDGEIFIWDLVDPTSPSHFPSLKGGGQGDISYLSWNRRVPHILASTSYNGASVVWDLKRQRPVLSFTDPNSRRRCSVLQWNPDVATQLIVASDDDRCPSLQVWDLRNSVSPVKELTGHTKGVLAMAWCPIDSAFLLSCAKDNRTLCWDTSSGEIVCELPVSSNWNFDVQWSPRIAGVLSTSSFDGRVNLYNIEACSRALPSEIVFGGAGAVPSVMPWLAASMRAPKWLKRPTGVCFGFGGKLVSFGPKKVVSGAVTCLSELKIQTFVMEESFISRVKDFEAAMQNPDSKESMRALCETKAEMSASEDEKEIWSFLKIMFEENARTSLLNHLGFVVPTMNNGSFQDTISNLETEIAQKVDLGNGSVESEGIPGHTSVREIDVQRDHADDGTDFFNNLSTPKGGQSPEPIPNAEEAEDTLLLHKGEQHGEDEEDEVDKAVQHALVVGNFKEAVEQCLGANRLADALVLAHVAGPELWERALVEHMRKSQRPYRKVMAAIVAHDTGNLVYSRPLAAWKETLALLCSYTGAQDWSTLCDALAAKLDAAGNKQAAILCYICATNIEEAVKIWYRDLLSYLSRDVFVQHLQDLMEKLTVLTLAKGERCVTPSLTKLVANYADLLATQGAATTALDYLGLVPPDQMPQEILILRDRIAKIHQGMVTAEGKTENIGSSDGLHGTYPLPAAESQAMYTDGQTHTALAPQQMMFQPQEPSYVAPQQTSYQPQESLYQAPAQTHYQLPEASYHAPQQTLYQTPQQSVYQDNFPKMFYPSPSKAPDPLQAPPTSFAPPPIRPPQMDYSNTAKFNQFTPGAEDLSSKTYSFPRPFQPTAVTSEPSTMFPVSNASITAAPTPQGFMPVSAPRASIVQPPPSVLAPAVSPQSPRSVSPSTSQPVSTTVVPAAPVTIHSVDTSNVPADLKPVIATLSKLYNESSEAMGGARANAIRKREIDDNSRRIGNLYAKLNAGDISPNAKAKLLQISQSLDVKDYATALHLQVILTTSHWDECGFWLTSLKRMIKTMQGR